MLKFFIGLLAVISLLQDWLIYRRLQHTFSKPWIHRSYLISFLTLDIAIICALIFYRTATDAASQTHVQIILWTIAIFMMTIVPKLIYLILSLLDYPISKIRKRKTYWFSLLGVALGVYCLGVMIYGATRGRNHIEVKEVTLTSDRLPTAFDGYRIAMFSDLHIGNYRAKNTLIERMVATINRLHPDMIVNGGDLVNTNARELTAKDLQQLSALQSTDGVYSVFGNHDLGFYMKRQPNNFTPAASVALLAQRQQEMGWHLLNNASITLHRGGDSLVVSGVNYPRDGFHNGHETGLGGCDLTATYRHVSDSTFNITISHTPQNWDEIRAAGKADLTLSGHVHAMQMKIHLGGKTWSPARWMYPRWSGLYTEDGKYLYINDGMGYVMYPMRIGAYPEITLITLRSTRKS